MKKEEDKQEEDEEDEGEEEDKEDEEGTWIEWRMKRQPRDKKNNVVKKRRERRCKRRSKPPPQYRHTSMLASPHVWVSGYPHSGRTCKWSDGSFVSVPHVLICLSVQCTTTDLLHLHICNTNLP